MMERPSAEGIGSSVANALCYPCAVFVVGIKQNVVCRIISSQEEQVTTRTYSSLLAMFSYR